MNIKYEEQTREYKEIREFFNGTFLKAKGGTDVIIKLSDYNPDTKIVKAFNTEINMIVNLPGDILVESYEATVILSRK